MNKERHYDKLWAVSFRYGQRHELELKDAERVVAALPRKVEEYKVIDVPTMPVWSALTHGGNLHAATARNPSLPSSFVPGRNLLFVTLAAQAAYDFGADTVVIGANQVDYSGYPDCRSEALQAMALAVQESFDWHQFMLWAPLLNLNKAEIWARADHLGILDFVTHNTLSCYVGSMEGHLWGRGCGECPSCILRAAGYYRFLKERPKTLATEGPA
jgi:7-cyano-7-deazaguanine synthase